MGLKSKQSETLKTIANSISDAPISLTGLVYWNAKHTLFEIGVEEVPCTRQIITNQFNDFLLDSHRVFRSPHYVHLKMAF